MALTIWTIGHSTRSLEEFINLLQIYGVEAIADVRSFPVRVNTPTSAKTFWSKPCANAGLGMSGFRYWTMSKASTEYLCPGGLSGAH